MWAVLAARDGKNSRNVRLRMRNQESIVKNMVDGGTQRTARTRKRRKKHSIPPLAWAQATPSELLEITLDIAPSSGIIELFFTEILTMILEVIAQAIEKSKVSRYRIAQDCEIDQTVLYRIVNGVGGCSIETADKLCDYLGLELKAKAKAKKTSRKGRQP